MQWIDKLIQDRAAETRRQEEERKLLDIAQGDATLNAFKRFCTELEDAVCSFNDKNPDKGLGTFKCEHRTEGVVAVVRAVHDLPQGQVTVSLDHGQTLRILHQPGGLEKTDQVDLKPNIDGQMYFWSQNKQLESTAFSCVR